MKFRGCDNDCSCNKQPKVFFSLSFFIYSSKNTKSVKFEDGDTFLIDMKHSYSCTPLLNARRSCRLLHHLTVLNGRRVGLPFSANVHFTYGIREFIFQKKNHTHNLTGKHHSVNGNLKVWTYVEH